jgi:hypothetical protein
MDFPAGSFAVQSVPAVPGNVTLVQGWFADTLPAFVEAHKHEHIAMVHIDCDLYSSTKTVLDLLSPLFTTGTMLVFDELFNYPSFENHEYRALREFVQRGQFALRWIGKHGPIDWAPPPDTGSAWTQAAALSLVHSTPAVPRVAFITAVIGAYESTCKRFAAQTIPAAFIVLTDNPSIEANGWTVDTTPYHVTHRPSQWDPTWLNASNTHTFCLAKYYKQSFHLIPRLSEFDVVVWVDGTVEITNPATAGIVAHRMRDGCRILAWQHEYRPVHTNAMRQEAQVSEETQRYGVTEWFGQRQPFQDCPAQVERYVKEGYDWTFFPGGINMWVTCFVAFNMQWAACRTFLDTWYQQTLECTTQDQISFPYTCWKLQVVPYSFPDGSVTGRPHISTDLYTKHGHHL